jgi:hypothetical protein
VTTETLSMGKLSLQGGLTLVTIGVAIAVLLVKDTSPKKLLGKDKRPSVRATLAAHYVGMSEAELIEELGPPKKVIAGNSGDAGPYRELVFSDSKWAETDFVIYEMDRVVSEGEVNGVSFESPGFQAAADRCADLWPEDVDRWLTCVTPYRAKPKKPARAANGD